MANPLPILGPNGKPARSYGYGNPRRHLRQLDPWPDQREEIPHQPAEPSDAQFYSARNAGREIYSEYPVARGLVNEIARFITSRVSRQYTGQDEAWGILADEYLTRRDRTLDMRGRGYESNLLWFDAVRLPFVENTVGLLLTESSEGDPKIQIIHDDWIKRPQRNQFGTVVGFEVEGRDAPISINDMVLNFVPGFHAAGRGLSPLALQRFTWLDLGEWQRNEILAARALGLRTAIVKNEDGEAMNIPSADRYGIADDTTPIYERNDPGQIDYIKSGHEITAFDTGSRPSMNFQQFVSRSLAQVFYAMGWDLDFSLEQRESGGASIRVSADRTRQTARWYFEHMVRRPMHRIDAWRLAKAVKKGDIPEPDSPDDFFAWMHVGGVLVTADRKFQTESDVQDILNGLSTRQTVMSDRGKDWAEEMAQHGREARAEMDQRMERYQYAEQLAQGDPAKLQWILQNELQQTNS